MSHSTGRKSIIIPVLGFLTLLSWALASRGWADGKDPPDPVAWASQLQRSPAATDTSQAEGSRFVQRVVVLAASSNEEQKPSLHFPDIITEDLAAASYLDFCDPASAAWSFALNGSVRPQQGKGQGSPLWPRLAGSTLADAVLWLGASRKEGGTSSPLPWRLASLSQTGGRVLLHSSPVLGTGDSPQAFARFFHEALGYDAVVMAQDGAYVLLRTPDLTHRSDLSALALADSKSRLTLSPTSTKTQAWLKLTRGGKHYSVFRVVSSLKGEPLAYGTKVSLENWL